MPFTSPHTITRNVAGKERQVIIDPSLLKLWWGAETGPQEAAWIVNGHLNTIDEMIRLNIAQGSIDPASDEPITLTSLDYEGQTPKNVPYPFRMDESGIKTVVARLQQSLEKDRLPAPDMYAIRGYDVRVLFETIKRYGGRKDWTPTDENIGKLAGPVRRHIINQWREIRRLERELIGISSKVRRLEEEFHTTLSP